MDEYETQCSQTSKHTYIRSEDITLTCWSLASLSMTVMIKSLARAKFVAPILSELSTMNARSRGAHLVSGDAHKQNHKGSREPA